MEKKVIAAKYEAAPTIPGCLDRLKKTTNNLRQDSHAPAEIQSVNLQQTSRSKPVWYISKVVPMLS
jgi:hypothetical protein